MPPTEQEVIEGFKVVNGTPVEARTSFGRIVPVTQMYDGDGDETADFQEALTLVAGEGERWWAVVVNEYEWRNPQ